MSIDDLLPTSWPADTQRRLDAWRQGHLIEADLGIWLAPSAEVDLVTGQAAGGAPGEAVAKGCALADTGFYAVTSQTCDIGAWGPGQLHPFVQVSPVRDVGTSFPAGTVAQIRRKAFTNLVYLSAPPVENAEWAIDLRISVPMSKGLLAKRDPVAGFRCEEDELDLGARVAKKYGRPALHDTLIEHLVSPLRNCVKTTQGTWKDEVEQIRLEIVEGTRLQPFRVRLLVLTYTPLSVADRQELRLCRDKLKKTLGKERIDIDPVAFMEVDKVTVPRYRQSVPLAIPELQRGEFH